MKRPWLPWYGALLLALQALVGSAFIAAGLADFLGIRITASSSLFGGWFDAVVIAWGLLAIVASYGIWRNLWWAYFAEILLIWLVIGSQFLNLAKPSQPQGIRTVLRVVIALYFSDRLFRKGAKRLREAADATPEVAGTPT